MTMRPSTEEAIQTGASYFIIALVGLCLMVGGGFAAFLEIRGATHTWHSIFWGCVSVSGALVLLVGLGRKQGQTVLQTIVITFAPFVPKWGGEERRATPPKPEDKG